MRVWGWSCIVLAFLSFFSHAQQTTSVGAQAPDEPKGAVLSSRPAADEPTSLRAMRLDVVVTDKSGKPVSGLEQADFTLLDNKQPRKILSVRTNTGTAEPGSLVEVILLIDTMNVAFSDVSFERKQIEKFLRQDGGQLRYPFSVDWIAENGLKAQTQPMLDGNAMAAELSATEARLRTITDTQGIYGIVERFQISLQILDRLAQEEQKRPGRKLVIWIGQGWPMLSGPGVDISAKTHKELFRDIVELSTRLREARIGLYSVSLGQASFDTFVYRDYLKGVSDAERASPANLGLDVLAVQSGGIVLPPSNDLPADINTCVRDGGVFYTLSFDPPPTDRLDEYHELKVRVNRPGLQARSNSGYYNQPTGTRLP